MKQKKNGKMSTTQHRNKQTKKKDVVSNEKGLCEGTCSIIYTVRSVSCREQGFNLFQALFTLPLSSPIFVMFRIEATTLDDGEAIFCSVYAKGRWRWETLMVP